MSVFILEDNIPQQQRLKRIIEFLIQKNNWNCKQVITFSKPERLLDALAESVNDHMLFLDIQISEDKKAGLKLAKKIRESDSYSSIVFVTTHSELLKQTFEYQVSALDFIEKEQSSTALQKQIESNLEYFFNRMKRSVAADAFKIETTQASFQVPFSEIYFFETSDNTHKITLVLKNKQIEFYGFLKDIEKKDVRLFRCHRSYIVNLENIVEINKVDNFAIFPDETKCYVSRRKVKKIIHALNSVSP
ncbi:LytR/AlgR family response regulator transcription factor [Enterococcus sp. N249-2]